MLETILNNFAVRVKEKVAELTNELKQNYDFQHVEEVVADLVDEVATNILHDCLTEVLEAQEVLAVLKKIGTHQGVKFHGFRKITVYLYTGRRVAIRSPWFVSTQKKRGRKKAGPNGRGVHVGLDLLGFIARGSGKFVSWVVKNCPVGSLVCDCQRGASGSRNQARGQYDSAILSRVRLHRYCSSRRHVVGWAGRPEWGDPDH